VKRELWGGTDQKATVEEALDLPEKYKSEGGGLGGGNICTGREGTEEK